jgi:predicted transcriptional regulator
MPDDSLSCKIGVMMGKLDSLIDQNTQNMAMVRVRIDNIDNALSSLKGSYTDIKVAVAELRTEQANLKCEQSRLDAEQETLTKLANQGIGKEHGNEAVRIILFSVLTLAFSVAFNLRKFIFGD